MNKYTSKSHFNIISNQGFTLLELMIVVAIMGVIATFAVPSYQRTNIKMNLQKVSLELESSLSLAKISALTQGEDVVMCPVGDTSAVAVNTACLANWSNFTAIDQSNSPNLGWIVFADNNSNKTIDNINDLISVTKFNSKNKISLARNDKFGAIKFNRKGGAINKTISIDVNTNPANQTDYNQINFRKLIVTTQGRIRIGKPKEYGGNENF